MISRFLDNMSKRDPIRASAYAECLPALVNACVTPDLMVELGVQGLVGLGVKTGVALKIIHTLKCDQI